MKLYTEKMNLSEAVEQISSCPGHLFRHSMSLYHNLQSDEVEQMLITLKLLMSNYKKPGKVMTDPDSPLTQEGYYELLNHYEKMEKSYLEFSKHFKEMYNFLDYTYLKIKDHLESKESNRNGLDLIQELLEDAIEDVKEKFSHGIDPKKRDEIKKQIENMEKNLKDAKMKREKKWPSKKT